MRGGFSIIGLLGLLCGALVGGAWLAVMWRTRHDATFDRSADPLPLPTELLPAQAELLSSGFVPVGQSETRAGLAKAPMIYNYLAAPSDPRIARVPLLQPKQNHLLQLPARRSDDRNGLPAPRAGRYESAQRLAPSARLAIGQRVRRRGRGSPQAPPGMYVRSRLPADIQLCRSQATRPQCSGKTSRRSEFAFQPAAMAGQGQGTAIARPGLADLHLDGHLRHVALRAA